jgi:D-glycero-alpha-D-manno-heptose-7-phosphate kinase
LIISRTPFRVSLFGGGSDYPQWYRRHGGAVFGFTLNKYCYLSVRYLPPFFEHKYRVVYSKIELVRDVRDFKHPAVRAVLTEMDEHAGLEIHHDGDLPARSGLGSSSSFTVGLLNALYAKRNQTIDRRALAKEAIRIEQEVISEHVGSQDQVWATYGGLNRIRFHQSGDFDVEPVYAEPERVEALTRNCLLVFTGISRTASKAAKQKIANLGKRESHVRAMIAMVDEAVEILSTPGRPLSDLGKLLHESWLLKRELSPAVTTDRVDEIYGAARDAGAIGGKLLGAGGGGFMLFYVEPDKQPAVCERLADLVQVRYRIDYEGSKITLRQTNGP